MEVLHTNCSYGNITGLSPWIADANLESTALIVIWTLITHIGVANNWKMFILLMEEGKCSLFWLPISYTPLP